VLEILRKKYQIGYIGGDPKVFLETAKSQNMTAREMSRDELEDWNRLVKDLGRDEHHFAKNVAKVAIFGPLAGVDIPMGVIKGLEFSDSKSTVLLFSFSTGGFLKTFHFGTLVFPETPNGKTRMFQYFKNMASEASTHPFPEQAWKNSEKIRSRMAANALSIEGFEDNLWETIL
jgi:hypothetical protein